MKRINTESSDLYFMELVHEIIYLIKHKDDYNSAAKIMIDNLITVSKLSKSTFKLSQLEIAKLTDYILESRNR